MTGTRAADPTDLVVAVSGRVLAESLAAVGPAPDVIDCFGDRDCITAARRHLRAPTGVDGFSPDPDWLLQAVATWAQDHPGGRLILGTGFEHQPQILASLARMLPLAGNPATVVAACKNPWRLSEACARLAIPTPAIRARGTPAAEPARWLLKHQGGSGGSHVRFAPLGDTALRDDADPGGAAYWQQFHEGEPVSLQFLSHARGVAVVGTQRLLLAPSAAAPFRFGGVLADELPAPARVALHRAAQLLSGEFGLRGLNGIDALWDGSQLWLLEINPRPTASLGLLAPRERGALLLDHLACTTERDACPRAALVQRSLKAGVAVVYAAGSLSIPADFRFPPGCHDLPVCPPPISAGAPVCSLHTSDGGLGKLRDLYGDLRERLLPLAGVDCLSSV